MTVDELLTFWFDAPLGSPSYGRQREIWFQVDADFDAACRARLAASHEAAAAGRLDHWTEAPRGALALVLLLDQAPRNLFRGQARAYVTDPAARATASAAIARGFDRALLPVERMFLYLPFEHSEALADQERALALFAELDALPETEGVLKTVARHHEIIARFGRFPHRNVVLARATTPEEAAFLRGPNSSF